MSDDHSATNLPGGEDRGWLAVVLITAILLGTYAYRVLTPYTKPATPIVVPPLHPFVIGSTVNTLGDRGWRVVDAGNPAVVLALGQSSTDDPHITDTAHVGLTFLALLPGTTTIVLGPDYYSPSHTRPAGVVTYTVEVR